MSTQPSPALPERPTRTLPDRPDLRHLKDQAKDLLKAGDVATLSEAQFKLAREYGFPSWLKLKKHVESLAEVGQLKQAIDANDFDRVRDLMTRNPALHSAPLGYNKNGPLTWAAECRGVPCSPERLAIARWMLENGSDVHQGGDGPLMRAALSDNRIPMMELLVEFGANVNAKWNGSYPIICAPCETLAPKALKWLIAHGADVNARTTIDAEGFGGHTPLFHTTVVLGSKSDKLARALLRAGADPNARATFRKQLVDMGEPEKERMYEYHNVTPIGFARQFQEPAWANEPAIAAIIEHGGT